MEVPFSKWKLTQELSKLIVVPVPQYSVRFPVQKLGFLVEAPKQIILRYVGYNQEYNKHTFSLQANAHPAQHYNYSTFEGQPIYLPEGEHSLSCFYNHKK